MKIINSKKYITPVKGMSLFGGDIVTIIGEQTVSTEENKVVEQYIYNIDELDTINNKPFVALKCNIQLL